MSAGNLAGRPNGASRHEKRGKHGADGPEEHVRRGLQSLAALPRLGGSKSCANHDPVVGSWLLRVWAQGRSAGREQSARKMPGGRAISRVGDGHDAVARADQPWRWGSFGDWAVKDMQRPLQPRSTSRPSASQCRKPPSRKPTCRPSACSRSLHSLASPLRP